VIPRQHRLFRNLARRALLFALSCGAGACISVPHNAPTRYVPSARDAALADTVAERTFRWFWETTDSVTGLVHDRYPTLDFSSVASIGFGLTAYGVGVERGWITREQAARRTLTTFKYLWALPQGPEPTDRGGYQGFFYHFLRYTDGRRFKDVELSTIDTSLLLAGVLFCQSFFDSDAPLEREIRAYADSLYRRVNWQWSVTRPPGVAMGWRPETGDDSVRARTGLADVSR
jgi:hypothetical protein